MLDQSEKAYPDRTDLTQESVDPNSSYAKILAFIEDGAHVLDVGCASGYLARLLSERNCTVTGVDRNAEAVRAAASYCVRTVVADLDREDLPQLLNGETFDVIIFADVLEHVRDPWRVLDSTRALLHDGGAVVASIPNIAHGAIRLALVRGDFNYSEYGILDDTHLRFFTYRTVCELFVRAGFSIEQIDRTRLPLFAPSNLVPALNEQSFDPALVTRVRQDPECDTLQFIIKGKALSDAGKLEQLAKAYVAANSELAAADEERFAPVDAVTETSATASVEKIAALESQLLSLRQQCDDLSILHARANDDAFELRKASAILTEEKTQLNALNDQLGAALTLVSTQLDAIIAQRVALEEYCRRQSIDVDEHRARATAAERAVHEYLSDFADEFGNIGAVAERKAAIRALRQAYEALVAQVETMETALRTRAGEADREPRPVPAKRRGILRKLIRRVLRRSA